MKIATIGDLHWGVRNDSLEFLDHFDKFFDEVFFPELKARGITHVIQLGDFVDRRKFVSYVTLRRMRKFLQRCRDEGIHMDILVGNHDTPYKNTNDINSMRELFSRIDGDEDYITFYADPTEISIDGCDILMLPWINSSNYEESLRLMHDSKAQVLFGHLEIKGFEMYRGMPSHEGFDTAVFDKFDVVASGHFHHQSKSGNIHYLGTPYEMTWSDYGDHKGFHIFDTDTRSFEFIRNPYTMFKKVWYDDTDPKSLKSDMNDLYKSYVKVIVQTKNDPYQFDIFLNKIYAAEPLDVTIVEDHRHMNDIDEEELANEAEDTLTILSKYVDSLETGVDKQKLEVLMRSLYNEALSIEDTN